MLTMTFPWLEHVNHNVNHNISSDDSDEKYFDEEVCD